MFNKLLWNFSLLFAILCPQIYTISKSSKLTTILEDGTIEKIHAQPNSLTVTSFIYNPTSVQSEWIDRIFGSKSVFYTKDFVPSFLRSHVVGFDEADARFRNISNVFKLPEFALWPPCSIEVLSYVHLGIGK